MITPCSSTNGINLDDNIIDVPPLNLLPYVENRTSFQKLQPLVIVVTYFQFDSNIRVLYVFLGFFLNT